MRVAFPELNDWQRAAYEYILQRGPLIADEVVAATALPLKEVRPILGQLENLGLIVPVDKRWRAV